MNDTTNKPFTFTTKDAGFPVTITVDATNEGQARYRLWLLADVNRYEWDPKDNPTPPIDRITSERPQKNGS